MLSLCSRQRHGIPARPGPKIFPVFELCTSKLQHKLDMHLLQKPPWLWQSHGLLACCCTQDLFPGSCMLNMCCNITKVMHEALRG